MIGIYCPTLNRAHKLEVFVKNVHENTTLPHTLYFVAEPEDIKTQEEVKRLGENLIISLYKGSHTGAANTAYQETKEPFFIVANDDFEFTKDWDTKAMACMTEGIGVVGLSDFYTERVMCIFLIRRAYIKEKGLADTPDVLFCPLYHHNYVDTELYETAIWRGAFVPCPESVIKHEHPALGHGEMDATYEKSNAFIVQDQDIFNSRRHLWQ
jgi:hypothetical protein